MAGRLPGPEMRAVVILSLASLVWEGESWRKETRK
jgi:hypothetical protein